MKVTRRDFASLASCATILGLAAPATVDAKAASTLASEPIGRTDLPWWLQRHEAKLAELRGRKPRLVFLGDSITQDWEETGPPAWRDFKPVWDHFYGDRDAINLGFKGDTTASLLWRIRNGEVAGIAPRAAVVLIGANNLGRVHWSAADTVTGIDAILAELGKRLPSTPILLLSVLPSERSAWVTKTTRQINQELEKRYPPPPFRAGQRVTFLDVTSVFMHDGALDRDAFLDSHLTPPDPLLHPTAQAQAALARVMEPVLSSMLQDKPKT
jgi:lysophospholipase L1-like esterase